MIRIFSTLLLLCVSLPVLAEPSHICASRVGGGLVMEGESYTTASFNLNNLSFLLHPYTPDLAEGLADAAVMLQIAQPNFVLQEIGHDKPIAVCQAATGVTACRHFTGGVSHFNLDTMKFEMLLPSHYTQAEDSGGHTAGAIQGICQPIARPAPQTPPADGDD